MSTTAATANSPRHRYLDALADNAVFVLSAVAAVGLAWLLLSETLHVGWYLVPFFVAFWLVLSYLVLPRIHRILTSIYVPDYFIGRARTSDGLLGDPMNRADWLAAGTFDRAVGVSLFTLQVTHKVAEDTDVECDHIVGTLTALGEDVEVRTIEDFSSGYHSRNGGGDTIETDGNLPVVDVGKVPDDGVELGPGWEERMAARANKRPTPITFGAALVGLRVLAGAIVVAAGAFGGKDGPSGVLAALVGLDVMLADWAVPLVLGAGVGLGLLYLFVGVLTFRGVNWARNTAMACSALLILLTASGFFLGHGIALRENMLGLPLDILVLLALSGEASSRWARRVRTGPGESAHAAGDKVVRTQYLLSAGEIHGCDQP